MSDLEVCPAPSDDGVVSTDNLPCTSTSPFQSFTVASDSVSKQNWEIAERRTDEILCSIRPTLVADNKRREVINYVHDLITASRGCEVFPYGSVPLKTYLPDGDIDLTAITSPNVEESLVADVHAVLKREELNKCSQFEVKDVHCIDAEVKLVKCLVQNIVVDISFNQLGGLSTLCFLEQVDGLIGKDHLFKRSIILIKAWCYYESRILGAHHGLLSTYALETLVLYIFHLFHSSLHDPLAVLYQFLDYFSKFDWENYCVGLNGPVCKSSLDVAASVPESSMDNLLLSEEFLQECADKFSVPSRGPETSSRAFPQKHLNIIDALKENNNLGRSVSRGNFYRIRSAFKYGACKLGQILLLPHERLVDELNKFFANTLERHENQYQTDDQDFVSSDDNSSSIQHSETCCEDSMSLTSSTPDYSNKITRFRNKSRRGLLKVDSSQVVPELNCMSDRNTVSEAHLAEEAKGVLIENFYSGNRNDLSSSLPLNSDIGISLWRNSHHALALWSGKIDNGNSHGRITSKSFLMDDMSFALWSESKENTLAESSSFCLYGNHETIVPKNLSLSTPVPYVSVNPSSVLREKNLASILGSSECSKCLLDLSGNYESYFSNLLYGKCYYLSAAVLLSPHMSHQSQHKSLQETIWQSLQLEPEVHSQMSRNHGLGHQFHRINTSMPSSFVFSSDEKKKSRGIGTYFPNMNYLSNRDRLLSGGERFQAHRSHGQLQRNRNGLVSAPTKLNLRGESQEEFPVLGNWKAKFSDSYQLHPSFGGSSNANDLSHPLVRHESGSHGHQLRVVALPEVRTQSDFDTSHCDAPSSPVVPKPQGPNFSIKSSQDRVKEQSYHLKNDVDFPPLSVQRMVKI